MPAASRDDQRPPHPESLSTDRAEESLEQLRTSLDLRLRALMRHEAGTRSGEDIEDLHQMRVAVRRMRATLKVAQPLLDAVWADDLRAELGRLGGALGPVRDLDVLLLRLHREVATLPDVERTAGATLLAALEHQRLTARGVMLEALASPRYTALLERLADLVCRPLPASTTTVVPELVDLVRAEAAKLRRAVERAGVNPADEVLHDLRIRGKRVRYAGEFVEPGLRDTLTGKAVKRLLGATAELQEVLGDHQDACVAEERIREVLDGLGALTDPLAVFVAGRLVERERHRAEEKRAQWRVTWELVEARIAELRG